MLAKAKSRGLTCTLVTEAINSDISWDEIKDLLQLKLCNADIHTYTSHFMEIQQQEKESLAVYVHQFKTEAKRCNSTNDAATIRIFIKGLKNAHSLATCIYEKDHKHTLMLSPKLRSLMLYSSSQPQLFHLPTVNIMSNEEDCCFQCQDQGHIAWNCPNI